MQPNHSLNGVHARFQVHRSHSLITVSGTRALVRAQRSIPGQSVPPRLEIEVTKARLTRRGPAHCSQHRHKQPAAAAELLAEGSLSFRLRLPLTRQLLCFGDLFWGHALRDRVSIFFGIVVVLRHRQVEPFVRLDEVLRHALALGV